MEEKPWLKSEFFAWHDGRRIVDLYELSKQMQCKQCRSLLDLRRTERETRFGLASVLYIACHCGVMNDVHTGRKQESGSDHCMANGGDGGNMYEVNIKASINLLMYGVGASRFLSFLALLDIPVPPPEDTSLIVPVTDDSGPMIGAPPSNVPQNPPAFNAQTGYAAPQSGYNIPQSGYNYDVQPSSQAYNVPPQSLTSVSYQQTGPSASFMSGGLSTPATCMPQTSASVTPTKELKVKDLAEASGDCQDALFASPPDDDDGDELEKAVTRPVASKTKAAGVKQKGQIVKRGRGRGRGSTPRKTPSATQTSAKKKKVESSDEEFVNPLEWPTSESESESDGKNSDTSWHASDQELGRKKSASKRKSKDEDNKQEEEGEEEGEEEEEEEEDEGENESDIEEADDSPKKGKRVRGRKKTKSDEGSGSSKTKKRRIRHERRQEEADNAPKCPDCDKIFSSIKSYNQHMKRVHDKEVKDGSVQKPNKRQYKAVWTVLKSKAEENQQSLLVDLSEVTVENSIEQDVDDILYTCPECPRAFCDEKGLNHHTSRSHKLTALDGKQQEKQVKHVMQKFTTSRTYGGQQCTFFRCQKCRMFFLDSEQAAAHIVVTSDRELSCSNICKSGVGLRHMTCMSLFQAGMNLLCPECGTIFLSSEKLKFNRHVAAHRKVSKFACDQCPYTTHRKPNLKFHLHQHQVNRVKSHVCELCGKSYLTKNGLIDHRKRIHKKDSIYKCPHCSVSFFVKYQLNRHLKTHLGLRPFYCSQCGQSFTTAYNLTVHERIHSGVKPYQCRHCDAAFAQKNSLNVHMKKHQKLATASANR